MPAPKKKVSVWTAQPGFQEALVSCPFGEIFAGGARGGGKTDGIVGRILHRAGWYGEKYNCCIFRQEMPQADDLIDRAEEVWSHFGSLNKTNRLFTFRNGARARFRPLETVRDAAKYQGQNLTDAVIEEAGNYPEPGPIDRIFGTLRSASGVPTAMCLTGNPGGAGQAWLKQRFVDPAPAGMTPIEVKIPARHGSHGEMVHQRIFIPGKLRDNKLLLAKDPGYVAKLYRVGNEKLVRAWLDGDWTAVEGAFFEEWRHAQHVLTPFTPPTHWLHFRSIDWGYARPFSIGWWTIAGEEIVRDGKTIPRGAMIRYREWYGCKRGESNVGLRLNADEVAEGIKRRSIDEKIDYTVMDPAAWGTQSGPSIAETMLRHGVPCRRADNRRIAHAGHMGGWNQVRQRLKGLEGGEPMLFCTENCVDSIRLLPLMQHDPMRPEDLDTDMEDHIPDEWRYACMSRPWARGAPLKPEEWREANLIEMFEHREHRIEL